MIDTLDYKGWSNIEQTIDYDNSNYYSPKQILEIHNYENIFEEFINDYIFNNNNNKHLILTGLTANKCIGLMNI